MTDIGKNPRRIDVILAPFDSFLRKFEIDASRLLAVYFGWLAALPAVMALNRMLFPISKGAATYWDFKFILCGFLAHAFWTRKQWPRALALAVMWLHFAANIYGMIQSGACMRQAAGSFGLPPEIRETLSRHLFATLASALTTAFSILLLCAGELKEELAASAPVAERSARSRRNTGVMQALVIAAKFTILTYSMRWFSGGIDM
jgi:hypothetical protein